MEICRIWKHWPRKLADNIHTGIPNCSLYYYMYIYVYTPLTRPRSSGTDADKGVPYIPEAQYEIRCKE